LLLIAGIDEVKSTLGIVAANFWRKVSSKKALVMQLWAVAASFESTYTLTLFC
jgi:hypothetical protein